MVSFRWYWADNLSPLCAGGHWWATQVAKHVSDLGDQHSKGLHQDQVFDNLYALCLALRAKTRIWLGWVADDGGGLGVHPVVVVFMKGVGLSHLSAIYLSGFTLLRHYI